MSFALLRSRHGIYYLRLFLLRTDGQGRCERRMSLRTKDKRVAVQRVNQRLMDIMEKPVRRVLSPEEQIAFEGEAEASRQAELYRHGLKLMRTWGNVDQHKDPLGFELLIEAFDPYDVEAYFFTQSYLEDMARTPSVSARVEPVALGSAQPQASKARPAAGEDLSLQDAISLYIASRRTVQGGTRMSDEAKCGLFLRVIEHELGQAPRVSDITNETVRAYASKMDNMPKGVRVKQPLPPGYYEQRPHGVMSAKTVFSHAQVVKQFIDWLEDNKYRASRDVLSILKRHLKKPSASRKRIALLDEEVRKLLDEAWATEPGTAADRWVPWLAAYTAARPGELCQLRCEDIFVDSQSSLSVIRVADDAEGQQLKTTNSRREIPVHPRLIERGFLDFVASCRASEAARLFPEERRSSKGEFAGFSKRINRRMKNLGIAGTKAARRDFYSLRHTAIQKLKLAAVRPYIITDITGHASSDRAEAFTTYGMGGSTLELKHEAISRIDYGS